MSDRDIIELILICVISICIWPIAYLLGRIAFHASHKDK